VQAEGNLEMLKRILTTLIILTVIIVGGVLISKNLSANSTSGKNQYRVALVKTDLVKKTVSSTGVLTAWKTVDIKSRAGGRLISLPVEEGTIVKSGQNLAEIDPSDTLLTYNSAKADIDSNRARVDETTKTLALQEQQSTIAIQTARANLNSARAAANAAKARYESAKSSADAQKDLCDSAIANAEATLAAEQEHLNQLMSASHPQALAAAESAMHEAEANTKNAEAQLKRQKSLLEKGYVAQSQVDQAQATYDVARATLASVQEKVNTIKPELDTDLKTQQARVHQADAALRTAKTNRVQIALRKQDADAANAQYQQALADVKQSEARLRQTEADKINDAIRLTQIKQAKAAGARVKASFTNAEIQLNDTNVKAPTDGIILKKYVEQGTLITSGISFNSTGTSIVQLGDISRMYVDVQVDETDVAHVDLDQKVDVAFDAYPTTPFEGKVIKIQPQAVIDQNITTVHVRVEVDNTAPSFRLLKPGMNATCEFVENKKEDVLAVPNEALKTDTDGNHYVEIAVGGKMAPADKDSDPDPNLLIGIKVKKTLVKIGLEGNDSTEILEGLKVGDRIITQTIEPSTTPPPGSNPFGGGRGAGPGRR
jgi:HlyD family secretion protein